MKTEEERRDARKEEEGKGVTRWERGRGGMVGVIRV